MFNLIKCILRVLDGFTTEDSTRSKLFLPAGRLLHKKSTIIAEIAAFPHHLRIDSVMFESTGDKLQVETSSTGQYYFDGVVKVPSPDKYYKRTGSLVGYTGHYQNINDQDHVLESPNTKLMIRGYTGHRPYLKNLCGEPLIPSEEKQRQRLGLEPADKQNDDNEEGPVAGDNFNFRVFAKHMDILERYSTSVQALLERGQTQETLLRIVQAKMSERVNSYALQLIRTRKLFEAFDINGDGVLDEGEFRICLEKLNIQFDDVQSLALFAYFDDNNDG